MIVCLCVHVHVGGLWDGLRLTSNLESNICLDGISAWHPQRNCRCGGSESNEDSGGLHDVCSCACVCGSEL